MVCSTAGSWVAADKVKEEAAMDVELPRPPPVKKEELPESLVREKNVGSGEFQQQRSLLLLNALAWLKQHQPFAKAVRDPWVLNLW